MTDAASALPIAVAVALPLREAQRLHPASLALAFARLGPQMVNILPAILALVATGNRHLIVPAIALFAVLSLIFAWVAWTRFHWQVNDADIAITSGVFSRNDRTIPFDRIQDVSIEQGVLQRMLGVATVGFETGSAASDKKDDGKLNAIALAQAQALRDHVRDYRLAPSANDGAASVALGEAVSGRTEPLIKDDQLLFAMTPRRLMIAGLFNFSLAVLGILFGLVQTFDRVLPFNPFDFDVWRDLAKGTQLESWIMLHRWLSIVAGMVVLVLLGMATGVVRTVLRDWGFRLTRTPRGFRRTRGLTTRTDVTIPIARVQAAILLTGLVRRWFGWYELKLQSLASDGNNESDHVVAPFARLGEADAILEQVALDRAGVEEGLAAASGDWHRSHPIVMASVPLLMLGITTIAFAAAVSMFEPEFRWVIWIPVLSALFLLLSGWLDWRNRRWHFDGRLVHITKGFLTRRHIILPARNVQSADIVVGPLLRRFGVATIEFGVPGGKWGQHRISAIPVIAAYGLRGDVLAVR